MSARRTYLVLGLAAATLLYSGATQAATTTGKLSGGIMGRVKDATGVSQMGATVQLFNRFDKLLQQSLTNEQGAFSFASLNPDYYSVHVSMASFVPAVRKNIAVQAGIESVLNINLATVFSSIEIVYSTPGQGALMSDDWKWVLRTSQSTRPVLRFGPDMAPDISDPRSRTSRSGSSSVFSDTRGLVSISAGDPGTYAGGATLPDLGTAFALATSMFGANQLQVSGNVDYLSHSGLPAAGFHTSYSRAQPGFLSPEISITIRQLYLPTRAAAGIFSAQPEGVPALRTISANMTDHLEILDNLKMMYGMSLNSVSFGDRLNYLSPYAVLTYTVNDADQIEFSFSSGAPPPSRTTLRQGSESRDMALLQDLAALASVPRISRGAGHTRVQRAESFELGYRHVAGRRSYGLAVYRDAVSNAAVTIAGVGDYFSDSDIMPDLGSRAAVFNIGNYETIGYMANMTQAIGGNMELSIAYGRGGALLAGSRQLESNSPDELRSLVHATSRSWASGKLTATVPGAGTKFSASYGWSNPGTLMLARNFETQRASPNTGLNVTIRQPIPSFPGMPGRLEATAELRNMLAEGYLGISTFDNRGLVLTEAPRAVRGGLSFIF